MSRTLPKIEGGAMLVKIVIFNGKIGRTLPNFEYHKWAMGAMLMKIVILFKENESHITKN